MEADNNNYDSSYHSTTNWTIDGGSLANSVSFESPFSPVLDDETAAKSPLLLSPDSSDSDPCEITITFAQKHEVRQIYVRSSARNYEVYYATQLNSSNEYLCTVRCGVAARDEEVIDTSGAIETALAHGEDSAKDLGERRLKGDSNATTDEDGWVEVKALDASILKTGNSSPPSNLTVQPKKSRKIQDLYEATAEISDVDPCISVTLRLLSLQDKSCLFVDEVYVFADTVDSVDSGNQVAQMDSSAGSSLMSMLVPTLLQLSKTRDANRLLDKQISHTRQKQNEESGLKPIQSTNIENKIEPKENHSIPDQEEVKFKEAVGVTDKHDQLESSIQPSGTESKHGFSDSHVERVLDQLVSRVSRIENLFLKFEESMIKPINSIDVRLQQVEQKLGELANISQNVGLTSRLNISAHETPGDDSDHNSSFINESNTFNSESLESDKDEFSSAILKCHAADSSSATQTLPSIVVTASEFVNTEDEEKSLSPCRTHKSTSIDDALASALAGFLSSAPSEYVKYTQALVMRAPEFSNEEDGELDYEAVQHTQCEISADPSVCSDETEGMDYAKDSTPPSFYLSSEERKDKGGYGKCLDGEETEVEPDGTGADTIDAPTRNVVANEVTTDFESGEPSNETSNSLSPNESDMPKFEDGVTTQEAVSFETTDDNKLAESFNKGILRTVLKLSDAAYLVDFEIPILEVKFDSQGNSSGSLLEDLLSDFPGSTNESVSVVENVDYSKGCNFISVDDEELVGPPVDTLSSVDMNYYDLTEMMPLKQEHETQDDQYKYINQETDAGSLI